MRAAVVALAAVLACEAAPTDLTFPPYKYRDELGKKKAAMVLFHAPWCKHCEPAAALWERLAASIAADAEASERVLVAAIDANENAMAGNDYEVVEYPSVRWVPRQTTHAQPYTGPMTIDGLLAFVNGKLSLNVKAVAGEDVPDLSWKRDPAARAKAIRKFQEEHLGTLQKIADEEGLEAAKVFLTKHGMEDIIKVTTPDQLAKDGTNERTLLRKMADTKGVESVREFLENQNLDASTIKDIMTAVGLEVPQKEEPKFDTFDF
eukprot:TRINITY_DN2962_c0_g3_i1.p1 TRINITY_DN2962_c0_g3~~TRINITY_DN2962_c0_g3_i1.p1  ORF type:complete len:263 (+),score=80.66 TRINITY_DN2962_c0_g3_i1:102-890(+)